MAVGQPRSVGSHYRCTLVCHIVKEGYFIRVQSEHAAVLTTSTSHAQNITERAGGKGAISTLKQHPPRTAPASLIQISLPYCEFILQQTPGKSFISKRYQSFNHTWLKGILRDHQEKKIYIYDMSFLKWSTHFHAVAVVGLQRQGGTKPKVSGKLFIHHSRMMLN